MNKQLTPPNHKGQSEDTKFFQVLDNISKESIPTKINNSEFAIRFWHF